jgi:beta-lactamase class A
MIQTFARKKQTRLWIALAGAALCVCSAACASEAATSSTTGATAEASPTVRPTPPPTGRSYAIQVPTPVKRDGWTVRPLALLSPWAADYAEGYRGCCLGIAVAFPSTGIIYTLNGDEEYEALSVAKVPIMLAFLERAARTEREISDDEYDLLERMITQSDNNAADIIWNASGGAKGVEASLNDAGIFNLDFDRDNWGETVVTAEQIATLLTTLIDGETFHENTQRIAMELMENVVSWQDWGVMTIVPEGAETGAKNGWYLEPEGWAIHSAGYIFPEDGVPYTVAIFSLGMADYWTGISEVESIARLIHSDIYLDN